jgi:GNAT superfamily N-acetyltransferase
MSVEIRPMREDELQAFLPRMREDYVTSMVRDGGIAEDLAAGKADADMAVLFPDGRTTPDQALFVIEADGQSVGRLAVAERPEELHRGALWILELRIDEAHRGRGYGRAALEYAEAEAVRRGLGRLALNVFAGNEAARNLYSSFGYRENAVLMGKTL